MKNFFYCCLVLAILDVCLNLSGFAYAHSICISTYPPSYVEEMAQKYKLTIFIDASVDDSVIDHFFKKGIKLILCNNSLKNSIIEKYGAKGVTIWINNGNSSLLQKIPRMGNNAQIIISSSKTSLGSIEKYLSNPGVKIAVDESLSEKTILALHKRNAIHFVYARHYSSKMVENLAKNNVPLIFSGMWGINKINKIRALSRGEIFVLSKAGYNKSTLLALSANRVKIIFNGGANFLIDYIMRRGN